MASESTFNAGDRVIDEFLSKLNEEPLEALIRGRIGSAISITWGKKIKGYYFFYMI